MGKKKKHKKKKKEMVTIDQFLDAKSLSKKKTNKKFKKAIQEIEEIRILDFESKKKKNKKHRRKINRDEKEFYYQMENLKKKHKKNKKWEKKSFFEKALYKVNEIIPIVKAVRKMVCLAIASIISIPAVKNNIGIGTLNKVSVLYNIAAAI